MASRRRTSFTPNTLSENFADIQEKDRYDVVLANPPFGGSERKEVGDDADVTDPAIENESEETVPRTR